MKPPVWGKVVGIIMLSLGSLGVIFQLYKFMVRSLSDMSHQFNGGKAVFGGILRMSESQSTVVTIFAMLGLITCVFYIIGGTKLMKASSQNYRFAKYAIIAFIAYNAICLTWMLMNSQTLMIWSLSLYVGVGLALDVALFIVFIKSDPSAYLNVGIKENDSLLDGDDEFEFE